MEKRGGTQTVLAMMPKLEDPLYADFARTFYLRKYNEYYPEKLTKRSFWRWTMR